ncbi:ROK family protein [Acerihabitans sp. TG2]|uniref:ROK family protein n=1 Tax=Acerihabitans sp. TG2 TaxID=3096008 RepID=UPI002B22D36D|nr:ROK family protein [Acerihabitans sp. TG2]MEA9389731.1 ROK family protein [Acerihabitans sp. TG2]
MLHIGLDIGGTKTEAVVLTAEGGELYRHRSATKTESYPQFFTFVCQLICDLKTRFPAPLSIGIALPGSVSLLTGLIRNSNILSINGQPLQQDLRQRLGREVAIGNDANCFALSEAVDGAGQSHDIVFGVTLGTGCGGGLAIGQRIIAGSHGNAAECGHNPLPGYAFDRDGPPFRCYCGQQNCAELFVSGTGLAQRFTLATGITATAREVIALAARGDPAAVDRFELYLDQLSKLLASIINLVDPGVIVLGGGLSNALAARQDLAARVAEHVFTDQFTTRIVPAKHGDSSGVRGAAWIGRARLASRGPAS